MLIYFFRPRAVRLLAITLALVLLHGRLLAAEHFNSILTFPVTDERADFVVDIGRDIIVHVRRAVGAQGHHFGWDLSANDRRITDSPNFFYDCLCGHGPRPHDLYAWHFVKRYYPAERILPVYGYPFEVRVRCVECQTAGDQGEERFASGTVDVGFRRLATANPRQLRVSDIVRPRR